MHPFQTITLKKHACMTNMHSILWRRAIFHWGEVFGMCFLFHSKHVLQINGVPLQKKGNWASLNGVSRITFFSEDWSYFQTFRRTETMFSLVSEAFPSNDSDAFAKERDFSKKWRYFPQDSWIFVERSMTLLSFVYIKKWCYLQT
jgi:hypothetical protein